MAYDDLRSHSFLSTNTIAAQYVFVQVDPNNANSVILPAIAGNYCVGVTQDTPNAGDPTAVCWSGSVTKVLCAATINIGQDVSCDVNGNAVAAASATSVLGVALTAGAAGFLCDILFLPKGAKGIL
jgi:hypothetical protein